AVTCDGRNSDASAASERSAVSQEAQEKGAGLPADCGNMRTKACVGVGAGDDVRHAVAVDVAGRYEDASVEARVKCQETIRDGADERVSRPVEDPDARLATRRRPGSGDDLGPAIQVEVCGRHGHPALEYPH